jgi:hypothetical protein
MDVEMNSICRTSQRYPQITDEILSITTVRRRYKYPFLQKSTWTYYALKQRKTSLVSKLSPSHTHTHEIQHNPHDVMCIKK